MSHNIFANFISIVKQASTHKRLFAYAPNTAVVRQSLELLVKLGYVSTYQVYSLKQLYLVFKYDEFTNSAIKSIILISKPGNRIYCSYKNLLSSSYRLNNLVNSYQVIVLSTSFGILTHHEAIKRHIGGEILFVIN
jgi:small subunit ribosomal protein S8